MSKMSFILTLREYRNVGYVFTPYLTTPGENAHYLVISEIVTPEIVLNNPGAYTTAQIELVNTIAEYNDHQLIKLFSRKKPTVIEFYDTLTSDMIQNQVRPYIERRLARCVEILMKEPQPLYFKADQRGNIYPDDRIIIHPQPAQTVFNFIKESQGSKYYLSLAHEGKEMRLTGLSGIFISNAPCCLVVKNHLFTFSDIDSKKLLPFFLKDFIEVPKSAERKWFEVFALNAIKKYKVNATGFRIVEENPECAAVLSLEKDWKEELAMVCQFRYGTKEYLANNKSFVLVRLEVNGDEYTFYKLVRDQAWERSMLEKLGSLGLFIEGGGIVKMRNNDGLNPDEQHMQFVNWLNVNKPEIEKLGFIFRQDVLQKRYYTGSLHLDFRVSRRQDWYDIYAVVIFGAFEVPFFKLRSYILRGQREYPLPDGSIAILPEAWFTDYRDLLIYGKDLGKSIRLALHHAEYLPDDPRGTGREYLEKYLAFQNELRKVSVKVPKELQATLRPYQIEGFNWMYKLTQNSFGGCLADDMGLGKTLQTICLLVQCLSEAQKTAKSTKKTIKPASGQLSLFDTAETLVLPPLPPSLIVVPTSLILNWESEIARFAPHLRVYIHNGINRKKDTTEFARYHVVITSYGLVRNDFGLFSSVEFQYLILDESQNIKNPESKVYRAVSELKAKHRLVLTGTPVENSLTDLWAQMNFVNQGLLGNLRHFRDEYVNKIERQNDSRQEKKLKALIRPFLLRRTKEQVASDLPPLTEQLIVCDMPEDQAELYETEKSRLRNALMDFRNHENQNKDEAAILAVQGLTHLRQLANYPSLVKTDADISSGKFEQVVEFMQTIVEEKHKVLIFSSFVKLLNVYRDYIVSKGWKFSILTGEMNTRDRNENVQKFQNDPDTLLFLISLKAGGTGLNLTAADYVFILDPWWNPAAEWQAISRAHRIGQTRNVIVYRFIAKASIEEKIHYLQAAKSKLVDTFVKSNNPFAEMSLDSMLELFS